MGSGQRPAKSSEGRWPELTQEKEASLKEIKRWTEEGYCQPKMAPSLLNLDWSSFVPRESSQYAGQIARQNPPEFTYYAFASLDAYASAVLATHASLLYFGGLSFICSLKRDGRIDSRMHLNLVIRPERGRIESGSVMCEMLRSFPTFLKAKGVEAGEVFFLEGEGCAMRLAYPGRMKAEASPFLRDRSNDLWPEVTLTITPTDELRNRARNILAFLLTTLSIDGNPN